MTNQKCQLCVKIKLLTSTAIIVHIVRQRVHDVLQTFLQDCVRHTLLQGELEHLQVRGQRVLVHAVDGRQVGKDKEQDGSPTGGRAVPVSELIDVQSSLGPKR